MSRIGKSLVFYRYLTYYLPAINLTDNCIVNVLPIGNNMFAITESPHMIAVDSETLSTVDKV